MSKSVKLNESVYSGVSIVEIPLASGGGNAKFKDIDEIVTPTGTINITTNGTHNVANYEKATVNVPTSGGIIPTGTKEITENGTHDVTNYASVNVQVPTSGGGGGYSIDDLASGAPSGEIAVSANKIVEYAFYKKPITKLTLLGYNASIDSSGVSHCDKLTEVVFEGENPQLSGYAFHNCTALKTVTFRKNAKYISTTSFNGCTALTDIYVPWSESDIIESVTASAPWGAENATIHYNS